MPLHARHTPQQKPSERFRIHIGLIQVEADHLPGSPQKQGDPIRGQNKANRLITLDRYFQEKNGGGTQG